MTLRDIDDNRFVLSLAGEMMFQLHPQYASLGAGYIVVVRVVARSSIVNVDPNLLFSCLFGFALECAPADVKEESSKPR